MFTLRSLWVCFNHPFPEHEHFSSVCFEDHLRLVFKPPHYVLQKYSSHITTNQEIQSIWNMLGKTDVCYLKYCRWLLSLFLVKRRTQPLTNALSLSAHPSVSPGREVCTARVRNETVLAMFCFTVYLHSREAWLRETSVNFTVLSLTWKIDNGSGSLG